MMKMPTPKALISTCPQDDFVIPRRIYHRRKQIREPQPGVQLASSHSMGQLKCLPIGTRDGRIKTLKFFLLALLAPEMSYKTDTSAILDHRTGLRSSKARGSCARSGLSGRRVTLREMYAGASTMKYNICGQGPLSLNRNYVRRVMFGGDAVVQLVC